MTTSSHWDGVYAAKGESDLSWSEVRPTTALTLLMARGRCPRRIVDVGAGRSTLVDHLLDLGAEKVTLLELSTEALAHTLRRLDPGHVSRVETVVADVTTWAPTTTWDAWHDRAVLHFLVDPADRARYVATASRAVAAGGVAVIGVFAPDGPEQCSGLPVVRSSVDDLEQLFGDGWTLDASTHHVHTTPWGADQPFTWVRLLRR